MRAELIVAVLGSALVVIGGCRSEPPVSTAAEPSYAADVEPVIGRRCRRCHRTAEAEAGLVLDVGKGFSQLVDRRSTQVDSPLVVPGELEASYLWTKLIDKARVGKGMPKNVLGYSPLPPDELDLLRRWIETGAAE